MQSNPYSPPSADVGIEPKTLDVPEDTLKKIKNAWVAGAISGTITLIVTLIAISGTHVLSFTAWNFIDVVLIYGLAYGIYKKNRVCAILLLAYFVISKILIVSETGRFDGAILSVIFIYYYALGVVGNFAYHKHLKENP